MRTFFLYASLFIISLNSFAQTVTVNTDLVYLVHESKLKKNAPVIIMLHGYGSNEKDLFDLSKSIDDRFLTFSIRAPFEGREIGSSWYELSFLPNKDIKSNYNELKISKEKILSFISNACVAYKADSTKVFLLGFSQGAIMAYDISLTNPKKIAGALALSGKLLEDTKANKLDTTAVKKLKLFIAHGNSDNVINIKEAEKAHEFLKQKHIIALSYKSYEMPHSICGAELNDIKSWLKKQLEPPVKPK